METYLLTTKLNIPPMRPHLVTRPHLINRLQEGLHYDLVLISAPAGFGKTTLLSEWANRKKPKIHTTWFSIDKEDNDPTRFWDYFIASLRTFQPDFGENILTWLHSSQPPSTESLLNVLINELSTITGDFIVILDDFHLIDSQQIQDGISYLLEHVPEKMHLIIVTRADPQLPLSRFRGKGTMLEIRTDDLRFNLEDACNLLKELKIPKISNEDITILNERTEGWVVGLKMAALSTREQKDIRAFIATFTGSQRYIMDYLMEEVLQKQTDEMREFLMKTSVLERLSAPLCDVITERQNSSDTLMELEKNHLFIVPLDESRRWYRYEHLFTDLLQYQCEATYRTEEIAGLHRKVSQWYEANGLLDDAIKHTLTAQDWENATRLITKQSKNKTKSGEYVTLIKWIQALPEYILQTNRLLYLPYCEALILTGKLEAAEAKLEILEKMAEGDENIKGDVIAIQATIASRRNERSLGVELAQKALLLLPKDSLELRANMFFILGTAYFEDNLKEAEKMLTESYEVARQAGEDYLAAFALTLLGLIQMRWGRLHRAFEIYKQAIELLEPLPAAAPPHMIMSSILYEWNDLEAAEYHVQRVIELSQLTGYPERLMGAYLTLANIKLIHGDMSRALTAVDRAESEAQKLTSPYGITQYTAWRMKFAIRQDDIATASELGSKLPENINDLPWMVADVPARLLLAQGKKEEAAEQLQNLYEKTVKSEERYLTIRLRVYQSLAAKTEETALDFLSDALVMAEPEGYIRTFVDKGKLLAPLLEKAISRGIKPEYAGRLLKIIEEEQRREKSRFEKGHVNTPYETLSERETEVLRFVAAGFSNRQIAERLIISVGTVKTHVHNIMSKLDAGGRVQVIARAKELNLL